MTDTSTYPQALAAAGLDLGAVGADLDPRRRRGRALPVTGAAPAIP